MNQKEYCVYILSNKPYGTLYIGMTSDLIKRIWQHKNEETGGFTKQYGIHTLVYFEQHASPREAINREKRLKQWKRQWKIDLIEKNNPSWGDLYSEII